MQSQVSHRCSVGLRSGDSKSHRVAKSEELFWVPLVSEVPFILSVDKLLNSQLEHWLAWIGMKLLVETLSTKDLQICSFIKSQRYKHFSKTFGEKLLPF